MLNKEQINKKLQEKRNEQIKLEYKRLDEFKFNYNNIKTEVSNKIDSLNKEYFKLEQTERDNKKELQNIKDSNISQKINDLNKNINESNEIIKKNNSIIKDSYDEKIRININYEEDTKNLKSNYDNLLESFSKKENQIQLLSNRKTELDKEYNNYFCQLNGMSDMIKKIKSEITTKNLENMMQRFEMIEENIYNLQIKKKITKNKKEMEERIKKEQEILEKIPSQRKEELNKIYENYNEIINSEDVDILNEMKILELKVSNYELETKKKIFFQTNLVYNLKKKIKTLENFYKFKSQSQKNLMDVKYKLKNEDVKKLNNEKEELLKKMEKLKIDIDFLNTSYIDQYNDFLNKKQIENENYLNETRLKKQNIEINNKNFENLKKNIENANQDLTLNINNYNTKISKLKDEYYNSIKNNQQFDKKIKEEFKNITNLKNENLLILKQKEEDYQKNLKEKKDRILYLERQNLKLTFIENQN